MPREGLHRARASTASAGWPHRSVLLPPSRDRSDLSGARRASRPLTPPEPPLAARAAAAAPAAAATPPPAAAAAASAEAELRTAGGGGGHAARAASSARAAPRAMRLGSEAREPATATLSASRHQGAAAAPTLTAPPSCTRRFGSARAQRLTTKKASGCATRSGCSPRHGRAAQSEQISAAPSARSAA